MMGEFLALASALCFGITHFASGLLARRVDGIAIALVAQLGGTVLILVMLAAVPAPKVGIAALAWGALSGVGTGVGVAFLFRAMGVGRFSVVVPLSDVAAVALPVLTGVVLLGERPAVPAWYGVAAALPALWLVSRAEPVSPATGEGAGAGVGAALVAGAGFGLQFVALAQAEAAAGLWPLVASRLASVLVIGCLLARRPGAVRMPGVIAGAAAATGGLGTLALVLFSLASREQLLTLAVVLTALYPVIPVVLGLTVMGERLAVPQYAGLGLAAVAVALVALG